MPGPEVASTTTRNATFTPRNPRALVGMFYTHLGDFPGRILWVNRGWVDDAHKPPQRRALGQVAGETEVRGLIRGPLTPGMFTPANDAAGNLWYWPDLAQMTASGFGAEAPDSLPFRLEVDQQPLPPDGLPRGGVTRLDLPNRHLEYALTWFALALALIAVYFVFARHRFRLGGARMEGPDPHGP